MQNDWVNARPLSYATVTVLDYAVSIIDGSVSSDWSVAELTIANFYKWYAYQSWDEATLKTQNANIS